MSAWHRQAAHCLSSVSSVSASCRVCGHAAVTGCTYVRDAGTGRSTAGTKWNWPQTCHTQTCDNTPWCVSLYKKLKIHKERNHFLHVCSSVLPDWVSASQSDQKGEIWDREFSKHWFAYTNETSYNWWELIFFFPLWLSYNWVWTSSSGELIDLGLNSSLFSLENNYAVIGRAEENRWPPPPILPPSPLSSPLFVMRGIISAAIYNLSQTIHCVLLSEKVELDEKCPPARYMKVWNCRLLFALSRVPQKVFLLLLTERLNFWWLLLPLCPPHPPPALIAFVSRSPPIYCCNFFNFSGLVVWRQKASPSAALWEMYINLSRETIQKKHIEGFSLSCSVGDTDPVNAPHLPPPPPMQLHQMNNQINVLVH